MVNATNAELTHKAMGYPLRSSSICGWYGGGGHNMLASTPVNKLTYRQRPHTSRRIVRIDTITCRHATQAYMAWHTSGTANGSKLFQRATFQRHFWKRVDELRGIGKDNKLNIRRKTFTRRSCNGKSEISCNVLHA